MKQLTWQDTQKLLHAIQELYSFHDLDSFGVKALTTIDRLVPSEIPSFFYAKPQSREFSQTFLPDYPGFTPKMNESILHNWGEHPLMKNMPRTLTGTYKVSDFTTEAELHRLEGMYHQYLKPIGCEDQMSFFLPDTQPQSWDKLVKKNYDLTVLSLDRSQRNFTERDRLILNLLRPHVFQAFGNAQRYHQLQQNVTQLQQSLDRSGVICLDDAGQVKLMTSQVATWLQSYFPSHSNGNELPERLRSWVKHQLSQLEEVYDLPSPCLPLRLQQEDRQLTIRFVVDQPGEQYLLLLAEERVLSLLASLELIGLSKREAEVLFWIIKGKDNRAIALEMRINYSTVRKHLENIYRKLEVQSRTEAISIALEKVGCLSSPGIV
jgi:DNA-binding CsgD family transcriptional regulator